MSGNREAFDERSYRGIASSNVLSRDEAPNANSLKVISSSLINIASEVFSFAISNVS